MEPSRSATTAAPRPEAAPDNQPQLSEEQQGLLTQIRSKFLNASWLTPARLGDEPQIDEQPWHWAWRDIAPNIENVVKLVPLGTAGADRRILGLMNPTYKRPMGQTRTINAGIQIVVKGEMAPSHRHTAAAVRFIIQGQGAFTIVDGEPLLMEPGDLLLTPAWTWHGHDNRGSDHVSWLDVLDVPLVAGNGWFFYEEYAHPKATQKPEFGEGYSVNRYAGGGLLPDDGRAPEKPYSPLMAYKFGPTKDALYRLSELTPGNESVVMTYRNPYTGGPIMPTISAAMHLLKKGQVMRARRDTASRFFQVAQGSGFSVVNGMRFNWEKGDVFSVPLWAWIEHVGGDEDALLFDVSDKSILDNLHLYRQQHYPDNNGRQSVNAVFSGIPPADAGQAQSPSGNGGAPGRPPA